MTFRDRLAGLFGRGRPQEPEPLVDDGTLELLAQAFEVERGDAAVLDDIAATGRDPDEPVLLRHVFEVDDGADVTALLGGLEADGYEVARPRPDRLTASSTLRPTVLATAQARARMTGLTTRHPVDYLGWEALGRPC